MIVLTLLVSLLLHRKKKFSILLPFVKIHNSKPLRYLISQAFASHSTDFPWKPFHLCPFFLTIIKLYLMKSYKGLYSYNYIDCQISLLFFFMDTFPGVEKELPHGNFTSSVSSNSELPHSKKNVFLLASVWLHTSRKISLVLYIHCYFLFHNTLITLCIYNDSYISSETFMTTSLIFHANVILYNIKKTQVHTPLKIFC